MQAGLLGPLRVFYGLGPSSVGAAGDNNHLYGRHRSYAWARASQFCTNRNYGTTDARDQGGNRNWYRAADVGITGQTLFDASRRMDALVRSGGAPGVAEWFGTFDGQTVVGWYQGGPSSSDSSHLFHFHVGFWNESANDAALMQLVYATITGTEPTSPPDMRPRRNAMFRLIDPEGAQHVISPDTLSPTGWSYVQIMNPVSAQGWMIAASGLGTVNGNPADPNHDPHADGDWRPGAFGPAKSAVRQLLIDDITASVLAALPPGGGGSAPTANEVAEAVANKLSDRLEH
jgi:hypothetical protein